MYVCQPISEEWPSLGFWAGWFDEAGLPSGGPGDSEPRQVLAQAMPSGTWLVDRKGDREPEVQRYPWRT